MNLLVTDVAFVVPQTSEKAQKMEKVRHTRNCHFGMRKKLCDCSRKCHIVNFIFLLCPYLTVIDF